MTNILKASEKLLREAAGLKTKEEKPIYTANFPDLVDLVLNDDEVKFLTTDGGVYDERIIDGKLYIPPSINDLDYLLPKLSNILKEAQKHTHPAISDDIDSVQGCTSCIELYEDLLKYHKQFSELPHERYYDLLVLWDFHTYLIENFIFSPIIYFYASKERGKTRTSKAMIHIARRGIMTETLREANLIRWSRDHRATLLFDVKDFPKKVERSQSEDLIYGRAEQGVIASRVLFPEKGAFKDTVRFEIFGPTVVTSNRMIDDIGESRAIIIEMRPTKEIYDIEPEAVLGLPYRERLTAMRLSHIYKPIIKYRRAETGRLEDLLMGFYSMVRTLFPDKEKSLTILKNMIKNQKKESASDSFEARIVQKIIDCETRVEIGTLVLTYEELCSEYNEGKKENLI